MDTIVLSSSPTASSTPNLPKTPAIDHLKGLLKQIVRVTILDGRVFLGSFAGTDQPLNILLINAEEYRIGLEENPEGRYVGQIVIPWKLIVKVEGEVQQEDNGQMYF
ncbi:N-alpha-acetyltransferase 38-A, NatC auxiliary subunit [Hypsizygus marmoreus]|uniref:N-alpha-acetyltransferase 38-A, NatC auxiliary subunit n=1 Tax=Hypsizygus marmoreus TaxID=39966 RepID=A0A369KD40_HYPMA|nr:N-alpha-acetyltransferase 38-A, NatC auxiliary subunit [Hypsizygus marmoreus]